MDDRAGGVFRFRFARFHTVATSVVHNEFPDLPRLVGDERHLGIDNLQEEVFRRSR
jgi:hypothetical protein